jgi:hypothetical protein
VPLGRWFHPAVLIADRANERRYRYSGGAQYSTPRRYVHALVFVLTLPCIQKIVVEQRQKIGAPESSLGGMHESHRAGR